MMLDVHIYIFKNTGIITITQILISNMYEYEYYLVCHKGKETLLLPRVRKNDNFPDSKTFIAKTFRIKLSSSSGHFVYYLDILYSIRTCSKISGYSSANNELFAKTFRIRKNFPVSIADALTVFLWLCWAWWVLHSLLPLDFWLWVFWYLGIWVFDFVCSLVSRRGQGGDP